MTYEEAERWLRAIGGERIMARETAKFDSVIVLVKSATKGEISRHSVYDASLAGVQLEAAIREAFVRACDELRIALKP